MLVFVLFFLTTKTQAQLLDLPHVPLGVSTSVEPNIMLLLDNSGSMENIIWADGYDPTTTYPNWNPGTWFSSWNYDIDLPQGGCVSGFKEGVNGGSTKCLKLPFPTTSTRYYTNYLNYLFQTYADGTDLTNGTIPNDYRLSVAKTVTNQFIDNVSDVRLGLSTFNAGDHGGSIVAECGSDKTTLKNTVTATQASANTPLAETYYEVTRYFRGITSYYNANVSYTSPIEYRCQANHAVIITDGLPTYDSSYPTDDPDDLSRSETLPNWDGLAPSTAVPTNDADRTNPAHYPQYSDGYGGDESLEGAHLYLDDIAKFAYDIDFRKGGNDLEGKSFDAADFPKQVLGTSTIGFAAPYQMLKDAASYGAGQYYEANNAGELVLALESALENVVKLTSTTAAVASNSGRLSTDSHIYQAQFLSGDWTGSLLALPLDPTDGTIQAASWNAQAQLDTQDWNSGRVIITSHSTTRTGVAFRWNSLSPTQQNALNTNINNQTDAKGEARLEFLRGSRADEGTGNNFRSRLHLLGDIAHSAPFYVGTPAFPDSIGSDYELFRTAYEGRQEMIYVGANDGMLHGFLASTGAEKLAYIPEIVFDKLSRLSPSVYAHRFYVDGSPTVSDSYANFGARCASGSPCWRSVLVSGLRRGGQGYFALDVTDPNAFNETNASNIVLWEFSDQDDSDLGYSYSQPSIVKMQNDRWAAVFGNGYNNTEADGNASTNGNAALFIVFLDGGLDGSWTAGSDFIKIDTGVGSVNTPNGLATPAPIDFDGDLKADYIYAGDLEGNLWKFDVSSSSTSQWTVANSQALFTATSGAGASQPITVRPEVGIHPSDLQGVLVYIGTGKYLETTDKSIAIPTQSIYAIWDKNDGSAPSISRSDLQKQEVLGVVSGARISSNNDVDWKTKKGWYMDLPTLGERQTARALLRNDRLIFVSMTPNEQLCGVGGTSWLMELDAFTGSRLNFSPFDRTGDEKIDKNDLVSTTINGENVEIAASGIASTEGILSTPTIAHSCLNKRGECKYSGGSSGNVSRVLEHAGEGLGRQAWRTLP